MNREHKGKWPLRLGVEKSSPQREVAFDMHVRVRARGRALGLWTGREGVPCLTRTPCVPAHCNMRAAKSPDL